MDVFYAKFVYHDEVPFNSSDAVMLHPYIDRLTKCVKRGLPHAQNSTPSRHKVADGLLDKMYQKVSEEIAPVFAADHNTGMGTDGYSNVRRNSVINYNLFGRRSSRFMTAYYPG